MISSLRRNELRLNTDWDDQLSYMLGPALCAYEMERLTGAAFGNDEFQDSIKRNVPEGHTFRGYPIVVNDPSPANVLGKSKNEKKKKEKRKKKKEKRKKNTLCQICCIFSIFYYYSSFSSSLFQLVLFCYLCRIVSISYKEYPTTRLCF